VSGTLYDTTEIRVCVVCIHLLCNGEYNDGTDAAERASEGMTRIWGDDVKHLTPAGSEDGEPYFSWCSCDGCGDTDGGERHLVYAMIPIPEDA
jgi:hypothetical protein